VAVLLGWKLEQIRRQQRAVAILLEHGGVVVYEHERGTVWVSVGDKVSRLAPPVIVSPPPAPGPAWLKNLLGEDCLSRVESVYLSHATEELVARVADLRCENVTLAHPQNEVTARLAEIPTLTAIALSGDWPDTELAALRRLPRLGALYLTRPRAISEGALRELESFPALRYLHIESGEEPGLRDKLVKPLPQEGALSRSEGAVPTALPLGVLSEAAIQRLRAALPTCEMKITPMVTWDE
jgi:hypothetical protein